MHPSTPPRLLPALLAGGLLVACGDEGTVTCDPDVDGIIGGDYTFVVTVSDAAFSPAILKVQNTATVHVDLDNEGTVPRGFVVSCLATPNDDGCPTKTCFPDDAKIDPVEPGERGSADFRVPRFEGIYEFRSGARGDGPSGQFIVQ